MYLTIKHIITDLLDIRFTLSATDNQFAMFFVPWYIHMRSLLYKLTSLPNDVPQYKRTHLQEHSNHEQVVDHQRYQPLWYTRHFQLRYPDLFDKNTI